MARPTHLFSRDDYSTYQGDAGTVAGSGPNSGVEAGAAGNSSSAMSLSAAGLITIIVIVVVVTIVGVTTATLFFIAKRREWTVRETLRRSARKVVAAITPRRADFPDSAKQPLGSSRRGRTKRPSSVPPTPRLRPEDVEKGLAKVAVEERRKQATK